MIEVIFELFGEVVFQLIFELLATLLDASFHASPRIALVFLKLIFYTVIGTLLAALSYAVCPQPLFLAHPSPMLSLVVVPLFVAISTVAISKLFEQRWEWETETVRFSYSLYFALIFAGARYALVY